MKTIRIVLWALVIVLSAAVAGVYVGRTFFGGPGQQVAGLSASFARQGYQEAGGPFTLLDTDGETVTDKDFADKPRAMFFGFTHCPDVCPTTLLDAKGWLDALGPAADDIYVMFVSVDPARDTPETLKQYVDAFDPRIVGLTPRTEDEAAALAEQYGITFQKVPLQEGNYTVNHTADTLLFNEKGEFVDFIQYMQPNMRNAPQVRAAEEARTIEKLRKLAGAPEDNA